MHDQASILVVNHDLSFFNHIHPEFKGNGTFTVQTKFPSGGDYKVFADFIPSGGYGTTLSEWKGKHAISRPSPQIVDRTAYFCINP
ncbi:hypothetical protein L1N85_07835 [Paenibacillus alkaliterrae]|uniref:hypothetical protein n=1 Tax=Paenibacillus alkaliterrae TaxID=320909 RepID=UPI001F182927|nr:hypothetical protein [Paenibacillus alkaliterrae]MCF2938343.1 hypothetical protein [Paenibacillus alkaliterrae]